MGDQGPPKASHLYYGAIDAAAIAGRPAAAAPQPAAAAKAPTEPVTTASVRAHQQQVAAFETQKAARTFAAPTLDSDVKQRLRELGEPICLFGEGPYERRERLRYLLARQPTQEVMVHVDAARVEQQQRPRLFFSRGGQALLAARKDIARFSLPRAVKRLRRDKEEYGAVDPLEVESRVAAYNRYLGKKFEVYVSQVGSERPMAAGKFSPGGDALLATSSWSPTIRIWRVPTCTEYGDQGFRGHSERVNSVAWSPLFESSARRLPITKDVVPKSDEEERPDDVTFSEGWHFASGSFDTSIAVWRMTQDTPVVTLHGHEERVNRVESHPSGKYLASTSHDETWRLWDIETGRELMTQEGHATAVYGLRFHPDGSLVFTSDIGGVVRGWDLRTGRTVFPLLGHVKQVLGISINPWRPNQLATGSDDNTVRIWDIRKQRCIDMILAHDHLISEVAYEPVHGRFLMTTSYDNSVKIWSSTEFSCSCTLIGHEAQVMGGDVSGDGQCLVSVSFDRTFKLWTLTRTEEEEEAEMTKATS